MGKEGAQKLVDGMILEKAARVGCWYYLEDYWQSAVPADSRQ